MSWNQIFVLAIIAMVFGGKAITTWIRARHGYPIENEGGDDGSVASDGDRPDRRRQIELLSTENGRLKDQIVRLEERVAVLERIATDRARRLSDEIEGLR
ncbi:MAG: hypothetical protein PGN09_02150 [Sphingomonas fennica]